MKRSILIINSDPSLNKELEIGQASQITLSDENRQFIYIEKMKNKKWRIAYTDTLIEDFSKIVDFKILREDD